MNKKKMSDWLHIDRNVNIQMPNEIFRDFSKANFKTWKHKGFAYAYYYLSTYIYRNVLYGIAHPEDYSQDLIINAIIASRNKVSYITRQRGLLEKMNYLRTSRNYPTAFFVENDVLQFSYIEDIKDLMKDILGKTSPNFQIREPIKGLDRFNEPFTGTFYEFQNTHLIPIERFIDILTDVDLGYVGIYIYAYISMMNDKYKDGYQISNPDFAKFVGCNERTLSKYTQKLEQKGFIRSRRKLYEYKLLEKVYSVK